MSENSYLSAKTKPHHTGHRDRLRERYRRSAGEGLYDYELLELALFRSIPRRDVKPLAKALIARFGSLGAVCSAEIAQLTDITGISEKTAIDFKLYNTIAGRIGKQAIVSRTVLSSWSALMDYLRSSLQHASTEQFRVLYLNKKNQLLADEFRSEGTIDHAPVYPREVVKKAIELDSTAFILVHNHPSGDSKPSRADIDMTQKIVKAAGAFDIVVHDHIIVGRNNTTSFKRLGLL
jgi:DNA repair protein RadC